MFLYKLELYRIYVHIYMAVYTIPLIQKGAKGIEDVGISKLSTVPQNSEMGVGR